MIPVSIVNIKKYSINDLGISSERYLLNKFKEYLEPLNLNVTDIDQNGFQFHHRFYHLRLWQRQLRLGNGDITVRVEGSDIIVKIRSWLIWETIIIVAVALAPFLALRDIVGLYVSLLFIIFGYTPIALIRLIAHKRLMKDFHKIVLGNKT